MKKIALYFFLTLIFTSCVKKQNEVNENVLGLEYYPTTPGKYIVYDVDSTIYTDLPKDTIQYKYLIKEKIADSFTDNTGNTAIRVERYIKKYNSLKPYDSIPWTMKEVYLLNANNSNIQMVESNLRFTKLIFPVQAKASWNGNALNNLGEQMYKYEYIDQSEKVNNNNFDNVLKVVQKEFHPAILDQNYNEKYAKGVGLVYKEIIDVVSDRTITTQPVLQRIERGFIYKQSFIKLGYE